MSVYDKTSLSCIHCSHPSNTHTHTTLIKVKGKVHPKTDHKGTEGEQRYSFTLSLTSALDGVGGQRHAPAASPRKDPVLLVQEAGWAPGLVWTGAENLAPTVIWFPDRPTRSEWLYRLSYRGPITTVILMLNKRDFQSPSHRERTCFPNSRLPVNTRERLSMKKG